MTVFSVAAAGCAVSQSMESLLAWRLVMALGGSASMVIPRAVVRDLFEENDSARVYSVLMLILGVSPILAPSLGSQMMSVTGWRGIFWVLAGVGVVSTAAVAWGLAESLPKEKRVTGGIGLVLRTYAQLLANRRFLGTVLTAGFTLGALFAYLTASSFVFIELHALTPQQYALVFGLNGAGLIIASQLNRWLIGRSTLWQVLSVALLVNAVAGALLIVAVATGWGGLSAIIALIFVSMSAAGIIFPNIAALAMSPFPEVAGSASALLGTFQFGVGAASGALVGMFHNGTAMPMALGLAGCAISALVIMRTMAR
jgi:DHA1 family bicyclomycin/chloramphenicol resistance-like MFS transporter